MSDITKRLAQQYERTGLDYLREAKAEIERLRKRIEGLEGELQARIEELQGEKEKLSIWLGELEAENQRLREEVRTWHEVGNRYVIQGCRDIERIEELEEELADRKEDLRNLAQASSASAINTMLQASAFRNQARRMRKRMVEDDK